MYRTGAALLILCLKATAPTIAQTPVAVSQAAATITAAELAREIGVLTSDSMRPDSTPSPELDRRSDYVAAQFRQLGFVTQMDFIGTRDSSFVRRYLIPGQLRPDYNGQWLRGACYLARNGKKSADEGGKELLKELRPNFATTTYFARESGTPVLAQIVPARPQYSGAEGPSVVLSGRQTVASLPDTLIANKVVFYVPSAEADSTIQRQIIRRLYERSAGVVVVADQDSVSFAAAVTRDRQLPMQLVDGFLRDAMGSRLPFAVTMWAKTLEDCFSASGLSIPRLRTDTAPTARMLATDFIDFGPIVEASRSPRTAPNVTGLLEDGTVLDNGYIIVTARLDAGKARRQSDSTARSASDATELAALLALARAFRQPGVQPRRPVLFLVTSEGDGGGEPWGANAHVAEHAFQGYTVLDLDEIGKSSRDTLWVDGLTDIDLGPQRPDWMANLYPELHLTVVDGGTAVNPSAPYFPFVRSWIPTLGFRTDKGAGMTRKPGEGGAADTDQAARVARLVFYVAKAIADRDMRPGLTVEGRSRWATVRVAP